MYPLRPAQLPQRLVAVLFTDQLTDGNGRVHPITLHPHAPGFQEEPKRLCFLHQFERPHGLAASYNPLTYLNIVAYKQAKKILFVLLWKPGHFEATSGGDHR